MENKESYKEYYINFVINGYINEKHHNTINMIYKNLNEKEFLLNNFISNYLYNKKNILIISSEDIDKLYDVKSIEIVKDKIINLNEINIPIDIVKKLNKEFKNLGQRTGSTLISKVGLINREISKKIDLLKEFNKILYSEDKNGINLIDKYKITKRKINKIDDLYESYRIFRIKSPLKNYSYSEVKETANKLIESDMVTKYIRYRRIKDNKYIKLIKPSMEYEDILESFNSINLLAQNKNGSYSLSISKYTEDFIDEFNSNTNMKIEDIENLSKKVNIKFNYSKATNLKANKFFNFFKKSKSKEEYNLLQNEIYNEYINNYEKLSFILNKTAKIKEVLVENEYLNLINNILRGESIVQSIDLYNKILDLLSKFKELSLEVDELSNIEISMLSYCYNNSLDKNNTQNLLNNLAIMKIYYEIEEEEIKNRGILDKINNYDSILSELKSKIEMKKSLTISSLNFIWENYLRENFYLFTKDVSDEYKALNLIPLYYLNYDIDNIKIINKLPIKYDLLIISEINYEEIKKHIHYLKSITDNLIILSKDKIAEIESINLFDTFTYIDNIKISENEDTLYTTKAYLESKGYSVTKYTTLPMDSLLVNHNNREYFILFNSLNINDSIEKESTLYEFSNYLLENDKRFYRVWQRSLWLNREEELKNILKFIEE
ncbi:hypothetical protein [Clostridium sp.]|uniref:hypothetical protein n=1 Tax=Clostridium sp. TaxID=1506 RepID=UPI001E12BAAB|nr:hypothetical protein [Clostridium sp.]MBS5937553.1 hypothetical protein [Clostridium sp.]